MPARSLQGRLAVGAGALALALAGWSAFDAASAQPPDAPGDGAARVVERPPGAWLPGVPDRLPESALPAPSLDRIRAHVEAGDTARALDTARRFGAAGKGSARERAAAAMLVGMLEREAGRPNAASEAFTQVRAGGGPLAPLAAWYEAEQDLARGRPWSAIRECEALVAAPGTPPDTASDCRRLIALGHAKLGNAAAARAAAAAHDRDRPNGTIGEQIEIHLALRWGSAPAGDARPEAALETWKRLAVNHQAALTGLTADRALAAAGVPIPDDPASRRARAISMRDSGRKQEAWAEFLALRDAGDDAGREWAAREEERFAWRTHHWSELADALARESAEAAAAGRPSDDAWNRYKVLVRAGRFDEAGTLALAQQKAKPASWSRSHEDVGRALMLAGRYADAAAQFEAVAARGGWSGRRGAFLAGFAQLLAGDAGGAIARFDRVIAQDDDNLEARYWRARAHEELVRNPPEVPPAAGGEGAGAAPPPAPPDHAALAAADRAYVLAAEPWSWYATLLRQDEPGRPAGEPYARDGSWPGVPAPAPATVAVLERPVAGPGAAAVPWAPVAGAPLPGEAHLAALAWPWERPAAPPTASLPFEDPADPLALPLGYRPSAVYDPAHARELLRSWAEAHGDAFPEARAIADLARVGLYELAGTRLAAFVETTKKAASRGNRAARAAIDGPAEGWRPLFLAARDHHDVARSLYGAWEAEPDPARAEELLRLAYPLAHDRQVWTHAREHGVDPMLVLGLMRQESTYDANALSRVGARGAMQIMPRTGHLMAALEGDLEFTAGDLVDPEVAIDYGIGYLGLLLKRFDGVYPLAVASYNGGPHNVSSWLRETGGKVPIDVFVEQIPFRETRDYVKKVSDGYAGYVALYAAPGSVVRVPERPLGDHRDVVDF